MSDNSDYSDSDSDIDMNEPNVKGDTADSKLIYNTLKKPKPNTDIVDDESDDEKSKSNNDSSEDELDSEIEDINDDTEMDIDNAIETDKIPGLFETTSSSKKKKTKESEILDIQHSMDIDNEDSDEDDDDDENYLKKFDENIRKNIISNYHSEMNQHNNDEINTLCTVVRNKHGIIIDPFHKTLPFLTKYEKTRILGERASQLNLGGKPYVDIDPSVIDGYLIALKELEEKKIPYIIRRPLPNGGCEYWKLKDLEILI
jgi:DNA-directed RNA polymerase I, II, and III subunit RPABC2